ncbi:MAG TPA: prephenate dehydrogenase/arogenate dehydrogenase family protein [Pirellulales bacterium]|jgi:prephenate dehydrogenase|nr:prephenate dehydrogenase/arogenate dehydrogenase family protein [Pirellulales bacterium]
MKTWNRVAIVGVGLIGGSIGIDLLRRGLARHVVGIGRRRETLDAAQDVGAVSSTTLDLAEGVRDAELVVVCTPVGRIVDDVRAAAAAARLGTLVTDAGSTKATIVSALEGTLPAGVKFVGSHPLAGGEKNGPRAAVADLFVDRVVVVTPTPSSRENDTRAVSELWSSLGARVMTMSPEEHDRIVAATSHLPHLLASALAACTDQSDLSLAASGWLDTTRVASGDSALWQQIFKANRENVLAALTKFEHTLKKLREAIEADDDRTLETLLGDAKRLRDRMQSGS